MKDVYSTQCPESGGGKRCNRPTSPTEGQIKSGCDRLRHGESRGPSTFKDTERLPAKTESGFRTQTKECELGVVHPLEDGLTRQTMPNGRRPHIWDVWESGVYKYFCVNGC